MQTQNNSPASMAAKKEVIWQTGLAIEEMHEKGWMHVGKRDRNRDIEISGLLPFLST